MLLVKLNFPECALQQVSEIIDACTYAKIVDINADGEPLWLSGKVME
jgi:hypothetical protein